MAYLTLIQQVYLNPDVQALLDDISVTQEDRNRVRVEGLKGFAPPETTKVAICGLAGYQAEVNYFATGLDIKGSLLKNIGGADNVLSSTPHHREIRHRQAADREESWSGRA